MLSQWLLPAGLLVSRAAGLTIQPTNNTQNGTGVDLALPSGNTIAIFGTLEPLTPTADQLGVRIPSR